MGNIVRWFEDFPRRVLELLPEMKNIAARGDRMGSLSLLIAPALIVAPYERLQTHDRRQNPQADYRRFDEARKEFDAVMRTPFRDAAFWTAQTKGLLAEWLGGKVDLITNNPSEWKTRKGHKLSQNEFWTVDVGAMETQLVWKLLRDALSHWNVATSDQHYLNFDEVSTMQRLLFYRSYNGKPPWDIVSVSTDAFIAFLEAWTTFLSHGFGHDMLAMSEAA